MGTKISKEELLDSISFNEERYNKVTKEMGCVSFTEYIDDVIDSADTIEDAVFIIEDSFDKLKKEAYERGLLEDED
ncbi:hypothetical protein [Coprobacter secundus]|uniref:hypothetical protein n=1 Tax=Coprobacter secundus TaxID=1501392 RepID=UPI0023F65A9E|nr:hypothetical protein [Coprobacter secundus]